jgi:hypothetical protein
METRTSNILMLGGVLKYLGWAVLVAGPVGGALTGSAPFLIAGLIAGCVWGALLHLAAEAAAVLLHIEQDARRAAEAAEALLEEQGTTE